MSGTISRRVAALSFSPCPLTYSMLPAWLGEITGWGVLQTRQTTLLALSLRGDSQSAGYVTDSRL